MPLPMTLFKVKSPFDAGVTTRSLFSVEMIIVLLGIVLPDILIVLLLNTVSSLGFSTVIKLLLLGFGEGEI